MEPSLLVYTTSRCGDCVAVKRALADRGIEFREVALEDDLEAVRHVEAVNAGRRSVPTLVHGGVAASLSRFAPAKLEAFLEAAGLG